MQSWTKVNGTRTWRPMEQGAAPKIWAPRRTREEAVHKCIEWTGALLIPAMRVIDLDTGAVVWQDTTRYPDAGERIVPDWTAVLYEQVSAANHRSYQASLCPECGVPCGSVACRKNHEGGVPPKRTAERSAPVDDGALFTLDEIFKE